MDALTTTIFQRRYPARGHQNILIFLVQYPYYIHNSFKAVPFRTFCDFFFSNYMICFNKLQNLCHSNNKSQLISSWHYTIQNSTFIFVLPRIHLVLASLNNLDIFTILFRIIIHFRF